MFYIIIDDKIIQIVYCLYLKVLLEAANLLQLQEVKDACVEFLQAQLCLKNCIDTYMLADLYDCTELITRSELYIQQHFS